MRWVNTATIFIAIAAAGAATAATNSSATRGRELFVRVGCFECHGYQGQGGGGPKLAPEPMPYDAMVTFVRNSSRSMPPYSEKILSDTDFADIYAYLQSVPPPPALNTIPALKDLKDSN
jgi:ubiquinol-cytochrome c reductase cytochrome c subunit